MIRADTLSENTLKTVSQQLSQHVSKFYSINPDLARAKKVELCETFSTWTLCKDPGQLNESTEALFERVNYWHQISFSDQLAFACSTVAPDGSASIVRLGATYLAEKIDNAISWVDKNVHGDYLVRLVIIPQAYMYCFWLKGETDKFLVIDIANPNKYLKLKDGQLYEAELFLNTLSRYFKRLPKN